jgi:hypothetical protein
VSLGAWQARPQALILIEGRLERHASGGGAINLLAKSIEPLRKLDGPATQIKTATQARGTSRHT